MCRYSNCWLFVFSLALAGCGHAKPAAVTPTPTSTAIETVNKVPAAKIEPTEASTVQSSLIATASEGTAEAAFQQTLISFQEGRLDTIFDFLPESYQADVENLIHEFAEAMDAELWSKGFALLTKSANVLKTKKSFILGLEPIKRSPAFDALKPQWDAIASGIYDVCTSEVSNVKNLKKCDVKKLLASGSQLIKGMPLPKFGDVIVTTVNTDGDTATLSYRETKDSDPQQVEFVRVEGKWLPKSIVTGWPDGVSSVRSKLADLPGQVSSLKPLVMQQLDGISEMLDQLQQAKSSDEFNTAIMPLVLSFSLGARLVEQAVRENGTKPRKGNEVHVVISRELNDAEQTKLRNSVREALNDPNVEYEIMANDGKTRFRFTPVIDRGVIVTVLEKHFDGAKVKLDSDAKLIRVELKTE